MKGNRFMLCAVLVCISALCVACAASGPSDEIVLAQVQERQHVFTDDYDARIFEHFKITKLEIADRQVEKNKARVIVRTHFQIIKELQKYDGFRSAAEQRFGKSPILSETRVLPVGLEGTAEQEFHFSKFESGWRIQ